VTDRDPQIQEVIRAIKSLEGQIPGVIQAIESGQKWQRVISIATLASVLIAVIAFVLSVWVNYGNAKREADVAASEALMRHYQFAAQHQESNMVPDHGIYTANIIVDLTDAPGERSPWQNTARGLLNTYEDDISREDLRCNELDKQFETLAKDTLGFECKNGGQPKWGTTSSCPIHPSA
jgi:hypothetical protein